MLHERGVMNSVHRTLPLAIAVISASAGGQRSAAPTKFSARDVFDLEWVADPQISPDGRRVVFARSGYDIMTDGKRSVLWIANCDGSGVRPLLQGNRQASSPRWSPDGSRILFASSVGGHTEVIVRHVGSGRETRLTNRADTWGGITWSPDGKWIAFTMFVPEAQQPPAQMIAPPPGAKWGPPLRYIEKLNYRADGEGYLPLGHRHIFVLPASGGTARQITEGPFDDRAPVWVPDGRSLVFSANRTPDAEYEPFESEIYEVALASGAITQLTHRKGPDGAPAVSPDGKLIAYAGFDDHGNGYENTHLYVMNRDGSNPRMLVPGLDRELNGGVWSGDGSGLFVQYDDQGDTKLAFVPLAGDIRTLADRLGGLSIDRPSGGAQFTVAAGGRFAFTLAGVDHPADLAIGKAGEPVVRLTQFNDRIWAKRKAASVEEILFKSSFDQHPIQGWITKPADVDSRRQYPLVLEIHGGPFDNYGARFSAQNQLYAADGFVVLSANPRGSTSYGQEFANLIYRDYPGHDFDDLMSGVDAVIARGYVSPESLFVTGGSGGGVLTAWIVGHTHRFRAAVASKPAVNWESALLTSDAASYFARYLFGTTPWGNSDLLRLHSPLTYVANVTTPTMVITGEQDYRAPSSEAEQLYVALKLRKIPAAMLRIPDASHDIEAKGSNLVAQTIYTIDWFDNYRGRRQSP
jgi:dipeptidyl aminopeptidase/acylaminoacyl peptidase